MILCFSELMGMSWLSGYVMFYSFDQSFEIQLGAAYYPMQLLNSCYSGILIPNM